MDERLCMGDGAIQIDPDEDALVETALECAKGTLPSALTLKDRLS